jgi:hypothetical protein
MKEPDSRNPIVKATRKTGPMSAEELEDLKKAMLHNLSDPTHREKVDIAEVERDERTSEEAGKWLSRLTNHETVVRFELLGYTRVLLLSRSRDTDRPYLDIALADQALSSSDVTLAGSERASSFCSMVGLNSGCMVPWFCAYTSPTANDTTAAMRNMTRGIFGGMEVSPFPAPNAKRRTSFSISDRSIVAKKMVAINCRSFPRD